MAQHILLYIENKGEENKDKNKILHYADGTIEVRSPKWVLLETSYLNQEVTMLDVENQFEVIYEDATPKSKASEMKKRAKDRAKAEGNVKKLAELEAAENEALDEDLYGCETEEISALPQEEATDFGMEGLAHRNGELELEADEEENEEEEMSA